jgi:Uncharacterized protein conserved in bacteria
MENLENIIDIEFNKEDVNLMSPIVWAYIGDSIYEIYVRTYLVSISKAKSGYLHKQCINYVKASSQAEILKNMMEYLIDDEKEIVRRTRNSEVYSIEKEIVRRTRNSEVYSIPKHADINDYRYATAFEGLIGFLYLSKEYIRLNELLKLAIEIKNSLA